MTQVEPASSSSSRSTSITRTSRMRPARQR
jgi:hypothetical protein